MASSSSSSTLSFPSSSLSRNWMHDVFPSFHGADGRKSFLSHLLKEFERKGIDSFIDNNIDRSKSIGPELKQAIRGSKAAIVLLSRKYASSSWCLDELVEIMECREKLGQIVIVIFYQVDPTDVKKQTGDVGKAFGGTCLDKTEEKTETWRKALEGVATIAGYHLTNWDNEAAMIEEIAAHVSKMLNHLTPSCYFDNFIGMEAHMANMESSLRMDLDEVRMIGIWGPPGIGKSTIARFMFHKLSNRFQSSAIMNIKEIYSRPFRDVYDAKLQLQSQMLSQMFNQKDLVIPHLGVAEERLKHKKALLVLDDVDQLAQLDVLAKKIEWFGPGSRIVIVTEDVRVLRAHGINLIYPVGLPSYDEALQMFCMYAFDQKNPTNGFEELAWQVVCYAGKLPLGLQVLGSYFRNMSMHDWKKALPMVWSRLDGKIESVLKFSYDVLDEENKELFLHLACFFAGENKERVEEYLAKRFRCVSPRLDVLVKKSLIYIENYKVWMHHLLVRLGEEIVRKQSPDEPGHSQFLVDSEAISEILAGDATGSGKVIGLKFDSNGSELNISESAFEGMYNLQFLKIKIKGDRLHLPHGLSYLSPKLRLLHWDGFPATCLPSNVNLKLLVELNMQRSKLEKLWDGIKPLPNLKRMDLSYSENLKELPDLSTAINLQTLYLDDCTSLVEVPDSIGSLHKLEFLFLSGCSKLEVLPINVNLKSLGELYLSNCASLKSFPEISTNIRRLILRGTAIEEVPSSIRSWSRLEELNMSNCKNLKKFSHDLDSITERDTNIQEVSPLVQEEFFRLAIILYNCKNLVSLAQLPDSLSYLDARNCESLERIDCSFRNPGIVLNFANCFKLDKEARDLIIQASNDRVAVLPGREIPTYFTHQTNGYSLTVKLKERPFPFSLKFKACVLLFKENDGVKRDERIECSIYEIVAGLEAKGNIVYKRSIPDIFDRLKPLPEHLLIFDIETEDVTSTKLLFDFRLLVGLGVRMKWGVRFEDCKAEAEENEGENVNEEEENEGRSVYEEEENEPDAADTSSVIIDTISKYTSNSEAGCSKSKVIDHFMEMGFDDEKVIKASEETKKRKKQRPFMFMNTKRTSEVGIVNGDCEAEEENDCTKTKKSRVSF